MNKDNSYYKNMHRVGMWMTIIAMALFLSVPFIVCMVYGIMPKFGDVLLAAGGICLIFIPMGIAELIAETPVMGSSYYLASVTGNILNLKLPAALNAQKMTKVKPGSEESDAIAGIAVGASSLVTIVLLAVGVLLLTPLKPMLSSDVVQTGARYVLPALFGSMVLSVFSKDIGGGVKIYGRTKVMLVPIVICLLLFFFIMPDSYETWSGVIAVILIPIILLISRVMYKKGIMTVVMDGEEKDNKEKAEELING